MFGHYAVEGIRGERMHNGVLQYYIKWDGFETPTWEPESSLSQIPEIIWAEYNEIKQSQKKPPKIKETPKPVENKPQVVPISTQVEKKIHIPRETKSNDYTGDNVNDVERQFIIRFPEDIAEQIHSQIKQSNFKDVQVVFSDSRNAKVKVLDKEYPAKLVDLPCITEAWKSNDLMTYYKSGDVSQMLVVTKEKENLPDEWESGLTAPMKNVLKHWNKEKTNVSLENIREMIEEVQKMVREEEEGNLKIEIFSEGEDDENSVSRSHTQEAMDERSSSPMSNSGDSNLSDSDIASSPRSQVSGDDENSRSQEEEEEEEDLEDLIHSRNQLEQECKDLHIMIAGKSQDMNNAPNPVFKERLKREIMDISQKMNEKILKMNELKEKIEFLT